MNEEVSNQLSIYLFKIKNNGLKEKWVYNNLNELYNFISEKVGDSFSEKVYRYINVNNINDTCKLCHKKTKFLSIPRGYREYCSKKCSNSDIELIKKKEDNFKKNNIQKWGVDNPMKKEEFVQKLIDKKSKLDYSEISRKYKENFIMKWGVDNPSKLDQVKSKKMDKTMKNWGVENPFQSDEIKYKIKEKNIELLGVDHPLKSDEVKSKIKKTLMKNFGVSNPMESEKVKMKFQETCINKYGHSHFSKSDIIKHKIKTKMLNHHNSYLGELNLEMIDINKSGFKLVCKKCKNNFDIYTTTYHIRKRLKENICTNCNPIKSNSSFSEKSIFNFIQENYDDEILSNFKIDNREIDIYLPSLKIGFEFNGLYWHSDKFKQNTYHKEKMNILNKYDISTFNIWEDDWEDNRNIVKSMILNKIGKTPNKLWARKCEIFEIKDNKIVRDFLIENHIQGFVGSKIKLGLFYNNQLVSLMTFGNLRKSLGQNAKSGSWELLRFCNKLNHQVLGGASKLLKYFLNNFSVNEIITYSKNDYSNGNLYQKLNFKYVSDTKENYYWVIKNKRINRFNFRKDKLVSSGEDSNLTELEIMQQKGYYRVFDSGNKKWIFNNIS